jgi:hypothetical protein
VEGGAREKRGSGVQGQGSARNKRLRAAGDWCTKSEARCSDPCYAGYEGRAETEPGGQGVGPAAKEVVRWSEGSCTQQAASGQHVQSGITSGCEPPGNENRHRQARSRGSHGEAGSQAKAGPATLAKYKKEWSRKQGAGCGPGLRAAKRQQCPHCNKTGIEPPFDKNRGRQAHGRGNHEEAGSRKKTGCAILARQRER